MFSQKRNVLTVAAVITTLTMAGGVGAVALEASRAPAQTVQSGQIAATAPAPTPSYVDDMGGGDS